MGRLIHKFGKTCVWELEDAKKRLFGKPLNSERLRSGIRMGPNWREVRNFSREKLAGFKIGCSNSRLFEFYAAHGTSSRSYPTISTVGNSMDDRMMLAQTTVHKVKTKYR